MKPVIFRCDGTIETGFGHVGRSLALAEALEERGVPPVMCGAYASGARAQIDACGYEIRQATSVVDTCALMEELDAAALVLDGYTFDTAYAAALGPERTERRLAIIDDSAALEGYPTRSVIINFTIGAERLRYIGNDLRLLLGPRYALIRRAVRAARRTREDAAEQPRRLLIALGGIDRVGLSGKIAEILAKLAPESEIRLISGGAVEGVSPDVRVFTALPTIGDQLAWADACVTGGGLIKYEAAYAGVPSAVVSQTNAEAADTALFTSAGLCFDLGHGGRLSPDELRLGLKRFLDDGEARVRAHHACTATFMSDPTAGVAEALCEA